MTRAYLKYTLLVLLAHSIRAADFDCKPTIEGLSYDLTPLGGTRFIESSEDSPPSVTKVCYSCSGTASNGPNHAVLALICYLSVFCASEKRYLGRYRSVPAWDKGLLDCDQS